MAPTATATPADILKYQSDLVRTGNYLPFGRINKIHPGPCSTYTPPAGDPFIAKYGRMIDLMGQFLPLAMSHDRSQLLITAPLIGPSGRVTLPDVPDPNWTAPPPLKEQIEGVTIKRADGSTYSLPWDEYHENKIKGIERELNGALAHGEATAALEQQLTDAREAYRLGRTNEARRIPQRLEDRTSDVFAGTRGKVLVFQPIESLVVQPEKDSNMVATAWIVQFTPDFSTMPPTYASFLVNRETGECHLYGGRWDIKRPMGEE